MVPTGPSDPVVARAVAGAGARMIEDALGSVVQVRSGSRGTGAGVIPAAGLVLTNDHVVAGRRPGRDVRVILHDGRSFDAEITRRSRGLTWRSCACETHRTTCQRHRSATPTPSGSASWSTPSGTPGAGSGR